MSDPKRTVRDVAMSLTDRYPESFIRIIANHILDMEAEGSDGQANRAAEALKAISRSGLIQKEIEFLQEIVEAL